MLPHRTLSPACRPPARLGTVDGVLSAWHGPIAARQCAGAGLRLRRFTTVTSSDRRAAASAWQLGRNKSHLGPTGVRAAHAVACRQRARVPSALQGLAASWGPWGHMAWPCWRPGPHRPCSNGWQTAPSRSWEDRQMAPVYPTGLVCCPAAWLTICRHLCPQHSARGPQRQQQTCCRAAPTWYQLRDCTSFGFCPVPRACVLLPASQDALWTAWQARCTAGGP